ncbi:MAG: DUF6655 family protein [Planctomycetaceae bacterium]
MRFISFLSAGVLLFLVSFSGCTMTKKTNTARAGMEQLLIANAIDQSLDKVDFRAFSGTNVYLEEKYVDCVDKNYVIGSVRSRLFDSGAKIVGKAEEADVVVEVRTGAVGTDTNDAFIGLPELALPGVVTLPEVRLVERNSQTGTAKIGIIAYDAKTKEVLGGGGLAMARSDDNNWSVVGIGPFQNGTVRDEVRRKAGKTPTYGGSARTEIAFDRVRSTDPAAQDIQYASGVEERRSGVSRADLFNY